ncbi:hypothetical protein BAY59_10805 [Prauserella coralliicola]|nr:hypothetical protein BAY59_10805 [Prauserella coralliicola]
MDVKISVRYEHQPADLSPIHLAITATTTRQPPSNQSWRPALRDTVDGTRVVWARFPASGRSVNVWLRDKDGVRQVSVTRC